MIFLQIHFTQGIRTAFNEGNAFSSLKYLYEYELAYTPFVVWIKAVPYWFLESQNVLTIGFS